jgi:predicted 3-demethylubiquinone-9 3-methyltransferase (glyoxalase superfamily)
MKQQITPNLWFDNEAEDAARYYTSIFDDSKIVNVSRFTEGSPRPAGMVMAVEFELNGQRFTAINGGPEFKFYEAISLAIACVSQEEIDRYWSN